jgi:quercetin dioxygenase-like cupin family protein
MEAFELRQVDGRRAAAGVAYLEFLRVPAMSAGLYHLAAGATDPQSPHAEDEVYHVLRGRARIRVGSEERDVGPGSVVYVAARVPHAFHSISEDLDVVVVFAPAEGTRTAARSTRRHRTAGVRPWTSARRRAGSRRRTP